VSVALTILILLPLGIGLYAYVGYPLILKIVATFGHSDQPATTDYPWPFITITVPCYNEERSIRETLAALLAVDYPVDRRQILVISDASSDNTDNIVREFAGSGVELLRLDQRRGKSAAENAAGRVARGEIIVNTDATIRILPNALKALVGKFADPKVGVASGRDVSVTSLTGAADTNQSSGESGYVGYEMNIRGYETKLGSIVGASGCFYGIRASLYDSEFPESLSRDFASALMAVEHGYRAISVNEAVCLVPQTKSLQSEFRRKIRTMARGLQTLWFKRHLMNPFRFGMFAWMLFSHKLCRWLIYPAVPIAAAALIIASVHSRGWMILFLASLAGCALGVAGMRWPSGRAEPRLVRLAGFALASNLAGVLAWVQVVRNNRLAVWEPTRR
jgi:cellulose synthase/poly-beta-1,6-N-acetylglucosamine synthase-like glycosyltransferase